MSGAGIVLAQVIWQAPQLAPAAVGLAAVVAAAVLWLYPPQVRQVPRGWRWTMPTLRGLAAAAITVAVVQPIVLRPRTSARQEAVVLLVDSSRSMSVVDRGRSPAELVALAGGLGALPPDARQEAAPGLRARLDAIRALVDQLTRARSEADYAALTGHGVPAANARVRDVTERLRLAIEQTVVPPSMEKGELAQRVAALQQLPPVLDEPALRAIHGHVDATARALAHAQAELDASVFGADPAVRSAAARLAELSRADLVKTGLASGEGGRDGGVLARMSALAPVFGFTFDDDVAPLVWSADASTGAEALELTASGPRTDLAEALRAAMQRMGARGVQAVVLISDGRQAGAEIEGLMSDVSAAGVPVLAVAAAAPGAGRDLSIIAVDAPASGRVGQTIPVRVQLRGVDYRGASAVVRLDAGNVRQVREVALGEEGEAVADFDVMLSDPGVQHLVVTAVPLVEASQAADEATRENNRLVRQVRVGGEPVRVTVIAGDAAVRQYASLHDALSRAPWITLREVKEDDVPFVTPRSILAQDVVILLDVPQEAVSRSQWRALERLVRERGGSVIVCAGQYAPQDYLDNPTIARLLPFAATQAPSWRTWPGGEPHFRVEPPAASGGAPDEDEEAAPDAWRQLPALSRYLPVPPLGASSRALLVERDTGAAVVTETRRGLGRLYFIGTDQTWRWHGQGRRELLETRDAPDQFWPRLIRLAAGEPYVAVQDNLQLDVDETAPEPRQAITVRARILDAYGDPVAEPTQTLQIEQQQDRRLVREVTLTSLAEGSGRYQGVISDLEAGDYLLRVHPPDDPSAEIPPDPVELPLRVAPRYEAELADVSGDERLLRRIADASGGQFLTLEQLNTLPARLDIIRQRQSRLVEYPLWDSPYLFVFVLACLSAEWALRKKFGLA